MANENLINSIRVSTVEDGVGPLAAVLNGSSWLLDRRDPRFDIHPYTQITEVLRLETPETAKRISRICARLFLGLLAKESTLSLEGQENLLVVLRDCDPEVTEVIVRAVLTDVFQGSRDQHARLLQVLISQDQKQTVCFWLMQNTLLGSQYAATIFSGMLLHGKDVAFRNFAAIFTDSAALTQLVPILPWLINEFGESTTAKLLTEATVDRDILVQKKMQEIMEIYDLNAPVVSENYFGARMTLQSTDGYSHFKASPENKCGDSGETSGADGLWAESGDASATNPCGWDLAA